MNLIPQAVRDGFGRLLGPLAAWLIRKQVRPNVLTTVGTLIVLGSALTFGLGKTRWGGFLLLLGAPTLFFGAGNRGALLFWLIAILALATTVTVVQRVLYVARTAGAPVVGRPPRQRDTLPGHATALQSRKGH